MRTFFLILMTGGLYLLVLAFRRCKRRPDLLLVTLTDAQMRQARAANGERKKITHAVVCGRHGQRFGTERDCLKYFDAWSQSFVPSLFARAAQTDRHEFQDFTTTPDLVNVLIAVEDRRQQVPG